MSLLKGKQVWSEVGDSWDCKDSDVSPFPPRIGVASSPTTYSRYCTFASIDNPQVNTGQ